MFSATMRLGIRPKGIQWILAGIWSIACFSFFQWCYPYHFFYKEQNQLFLWSVDYLATYFDQPAWLACLIGDFLTQFYYYLYAGATILTLSLLLLIGVTYATLRLLGMNKWLAIGVALALATLEAVFHLRYDFKLSSTFALIGWLTILLVVIKAVPWRRWWTYALALLVALPLAYWMFGYQVVGRISSPSWYLEKQLAVDSEYYFGNWEKVVTLVESEAQPTPEMLFFYNLVKAQQGQLPDVLLKYTPNEMGTFYKIGPGTPMLTIRNMNELYFALGDMTFTERAAMMACVFSPDNRNSRMIRRLAECAIISGDTLASRKFLGLLEKTFVWHDWARLAPQAERYRNKALFNNQQDTLSLSDNAHFIMMQLLDSNPQNETALDYILCSNLLLKDITNFKRDYDRYCSDRPRLKKLYQEALCIWLAGSQASQEEWQHYIKRNDILQQFMQYNRQRGSKAFRDTYWYYFDKIKAPQP